MVNHRAEAWPVSFQGQHLKARRRDLGDRRFDRSVSDRSFIDAVEDKDGNPDSDAKLHEDGHSHAHRNPNGNPDRDAAADPDGLCPGTDLAWRPDRALQGGNMAMLNLKRIEKKDIDTEEELEAERLRHAPVLGADAWYACFWWALWRMITTQVMTRAGLWVIASTALAYYFCLQVFKAEEIHEGTMTMAYGFGAHCILAWMWYCAPQQAKLIMEALAFRIRGEKFPPPPAEAPKPSEGTS